MTKTENYDILEHLVQLRYGGKENRKVYDQVVKNYNEVELFNSLSNYEKATLMRQLYGMEVNSLTYYLKYLKVEYVREEIELPDTKQQVQLLSQNAYVIGRKGLYNERGCPVLFIYFIYPMLRSNRIAEEIFKGHKNVFNFLHRNGLVYNYKNLLIEKLQLGKDPQIINRRRLLLLAAVTTRNNVQQNLNDFEKLLNGQ